MSTRQLSTSSCRSSISSIQTEMDAVSSALGIVRPWPRLAFDVPAWDNPSGPIKLDLTQWTLMHCSIIVCRASTLSDPLQHTDHQPGSTMTVFHAKKELSDETALSAPSSSRAIASQLGTSAFPRLLRLRDRNRIGTLL